MVVVGERRQKREAAWGKGNVKKTPRMLVRLRQESTSQTLQICEGLSSVRTVLKHSHAHSGETSGEISKHSILRLLGAFVEACQGTLSSCAQHVPLVQASLVETSPLSCVISEWPSPGSLSMLSKRNHDPGPLGHHTQKNTDPTHGAAASKKGPLVCLTWLSNRRRSDFTQVLGPGDLVGKISWSFQDYRVSVKSLGMG